MAIESLRVLVCGGRHYGDERQLFGFFDALRPTHIVASGMSGAPHIARLWAEARGLESTTIPPRYGRFSEVNQRMLDEGQPDLVLLFPGDDDVEDMHKRAWARRVRSMCVGNWWD